MSGSQVAASAGVAKPKVTGQPGVCPVTTRADAGRSDSAAIDAAIETIGAIQPAAVE
jgi:hypothetical protein